jgi:hypothetical protein
MTLHPHVRAEFERVAQLSLPDIFLLLVRMDSKGVHTVTSTNGEATPELMAKVAGVMLARLAVIIARSEQEQLPTEEARDMDTALAYVLEVSRAEAEVQLGPSFVALNVLPTHSV